MAAESISMTAVLQLSEYTQKHFSDYFQATTDALNEMLGYIEKNGPMTAMKYAEIGEKMYGAAKGVAVELQNSVQLRGAGGEWLIPRELAASWVSKIESEVAGSAQKFEIAGRWSEDALKAARSLEYLNPAGRVVDVMQVGAKFWLAHETQNPEDLSEAWKTLGETVGGNLGGLAGASLGTWVVTQAAVNWAALAFLGTTAAGPLVVFLFAGALAYGGMKFGGLLGLESDTAINSLSDLFYTASITRSPILIDLDGDGVSTLGQEQAVHFDIDGNGFSELTGWVGPNDALLVLDRNANGKIDDGSELFGNYTETSPGVDAANGFLALATQDSNGDGKIDSYDTSFASLRVWKDANSNGVTDTGELLTLDEAKVKSISLTYTEQTVTDANGNQHLQTGQYVDTSGVAHAVTDVWFKVDTARTIDKNLVAVSAEIEALPDIAGFGNVDSLHQAMARDSTGHLVDLVGQFAAATEPDARKAIVTTLIYAWAGVEGVDPLSRASVYIYGNAIGDARKLESLEEFLGQEYVGVHYWGELSPNPHGPASRYLLIAFDQLVDYVSSQLLRQTTFKSLYDSILLVYDETGDRLTLDVKGVVSQLEAAYNENASQGLLLLSEFAATLTHVGSLGEETAAALRAAGVSGAVGFAGALAGFGQNHGVGTSDADSLVGGEAVDDVISGLGGDDFLTGHGGNDTLVGGTGNDFLMGGDGADSYLFELGWGKDDIVNRDADGTGVKEDEIAFGPGIDSELMQVHREGEDLVLSLDGTNDSVTVFSFFDDDVTGSRGYAIERIRFDEGTEWDVPFIKSKVLAVTAGNDSIAGYESADTLSGLDGNDTIRGWGGNDSLSGGNGDDRIYGDGADDVVLGERGDDELYGGIGNDSLSGGVGDDDLQGEAGADTLDGGAGNDGLKGGAGADVYGFGRGSGQDTISNYDLDASGTNADMVQLGAGLTPADLTFMRAGNNLLIAVNGTNDQLQVTNYFYLDGASKYGLETIRFADGTSWDLATVKGKVLLPTAGNDSLSGYAGADAVSGGDGNDTLTGLTGDDTLDGGAGADSLQGGDGSDALTGGTGNDALTGGSGNDSMTGGAGNDNLGGDAGADTLDGGAGNDTLAGDAGADVYLFGRGSGQDTVSNYDADALGTNADMVQLGAGLTPADLTFTRSVNSLLISVNGTNDRLEVSNYFYLEGASSYGLETIRFADGTSWDLATVKGKVLLPTVGKDTLLGYSSGDAIGGGDGNDTLTGLAGDDTLDGGTGADSLQGGEGNDALQGGTGADTLGGDAGADSVFGGEGNDDLQGDAGADTLDGGAGNDALSGGAGADVYLFGLGSGEDTITNSDSDAVGVNADTLQLGAGLTAADLSFVRSGNNLLVHINGTNDRVQVTSYFLQEGASKNVVEAVRFADGVIWDLATVSASLTVLPADQVIAGTTTADTMIGGPGNDRLTGNAGDDTLDGGVGNDTLTGSAGNDTYRFGLGSGQDTITGSDSTVGKLDVVELGAGVLVSYVQLARNGDALELIVGSAGDSLTVSNYFNGEAAGGYQVEQIRFTDGTTWDVAAVKARALVSATSENDTLYGYASADVIDGLAGNDTLYGRAGNDTLSGSAGEDRLDGEDGDDSLQGGAHDDTLYGGNGADWLLGQDGNDSLYGEAGNDTLEGGAGNDALTGALGNDTYMFGLGSGQDTINGADATAGKLDVIEFGAGVLVSDVVLSRSSDALVLRISSTGDSLTVSNYFNGEAAGGYQVEQIRFADGTTWDVAAVKARALVSATSENETLYGYASADVIDGLAGNDTLYGRAGNDTLNGSAGEDRLYGEDGNDTLQGGAHDDTLYGGNGADRLLGQDGNDALYGESGNDTLDGGVGDDSLYGGAGDDAYVVDDQPVWIVEYANDGIDVVVSSVSYTLENNVENLFVSTTSGVVATGNTLNNSITGNAGNDTLDGAAGADAVAGGGGDDTYYVDNTGDLITEAASAGNDQVFSSVNYTLSGNLESLTLISSATNGGGNSLDNTVKGNAANNLLAGAAGNDTLDGAAGADTLIGGLGDDTYYRDNVAEVLTELVGEGTDTVLSSLSYTLADNLENLTLTGAAVNGAGNALANLLTGNSLNNLLLGADGDDTLLGAFGSDTLNGGAGADSMLGGVGNDTYYRDNSGDAVVESAAAGTDTVISTVNYTLAANVENLTLDVGAVNGGGNALDNVVVGNAAINLLAGAAGNDNLDGGAAADSLYGGLGNDTYYRDDAGDTITENAGEGNDTVISSVNYTPAANVENLTLTGTATNGGGNALNNLIIGNALVNLLAGAAGNDTLNGGAGADSMIGSVGDDTYYRDNAGDAITENAGEGNDTVISSVNYTLAANLEHLTLAGSATNGGGNALNNAMTGNALANLLVGAAGNDTLDGVAGADSLTGGLGDDTYYRDHAGDVITEVVGEGSDKVFSSVNYTLAANVEDLALIGVATNGGGNALANRITGNELANLLTGAAGNDTMVGGAGNDTLNGESGADSLMGGLGDDTYDRDDAGDTITENAGEGNDTVISSVNYTLAANVENLTLTGTATNGGGNGLNNLIIGNALVNLLAGAAGNDTLNGGAGADSMIGSVGDDTYYRDNAGDAITENAGEGSDTVVSSVNYTLLANLEHLTLAGSATNGGGNTLNNAMTGNALNNLLVGASGNDTLDGAAGADSLTGGLGDDTYYRDNAGDLITENAGEGADKVFSSVNYTLAANVENLTLTGAATNGGGNALNNLIVGNELANLLVGAAGNDTIEGGAGNDTLNGDAGADSLAGGLGDDTYDRDNAGDTITENAGEGNDTVISSVNYTLVANVENLTLTGTATNGGGNALNNLIIGNALVNLLAGAAGNDTLNGGAGADSMIGSVGDDTYYRDNAGDAITENAGEGSDTVISSVNYTLLANLEHLTLAGSATNGGGNTLNNAMTGNALNNLLVGAAGNDTLDGAAGADSLTGGLGDDTYYRDNAGDVITENAGEGADKVFSSVNYTLVANVENLTLTGAATNGGGNALANTLLGNANNNLLSGAAGNDTLLGGLGNDTLIGGDGEDTFVFGSVLSAANNADVISDFSEGDRIELDNDIFTELAGLGELSAEQFFAGAGLTGSTQASRGPGLYYDTSTGSLYYDADGSGSGLGVKFASLAGAPALSSVAIQIQD